MLIRPALPIVACFLLACSAAKSTPETTKVDPKSTPDEPAEPTEPAEPAESEQPAEPSSAAIELSFGQAKELTVPVGAELIYEFKSHASVGYGGKYEIGDPAILEYVRTDKDYEQSEAERAGKAGADAATGTFVFKALAPGQTTLLVAESLRGTLENEQTYTITVTAP